MALTLIFSFSTFFAIAEISPSGEINYKVTIDYSIDEKEPIFEYVKDGDKYTLTANTESESGDFKFLRWSIEGDYIIVSGSLDSTTLVIKPLGDIKIVQIVELITSPDGEGESEQEPEKEPDEDKEPEKKPEEDKESDEDKKPEKEPDEDKKPAEDKNPDKKPDKKPQGDKNDSETSPPTGNGILNILGGLFLTSLISCLAFKKLAK